MSHPSVVTLDARSISRRLMAGDTLVEVPLPVGTRVVYPRQPIPAFRDPLGVIRQAFDEPLDSEPLSVRLTRGMKVAVVVEALYLGSASSLHWLGELLSEVVSLAARRDVGETTVLLATGIHRRLFVEEKKLLLRRVDLRANTHVEECDPEGPTPLTEVTEADGRVIGLHPAVASADLVITLAVSSMPEGGGYAALVLGSGGYSNASAVASSSNISSLSEALKCIGGLIEAKLPVFSIELVLDSRHTNPHQDFLGANEDDLTNGQRVQLTGFSHLPRPAALRIATDPAVAVGLIGVFAGSTRRVEVAARRRYMEQHGVPLSHQSDVLITGLPACGPYNTRASLNPVLVRHLLQGWLLRAYQGRSPLKPGGTVVLLHPCTNRFDHEQHTAHYNFFLSVVKRVDSPAAWAAAETEFVKNPALLAMFRNGHAYHPGHPFLVWQQASQLNPPVGRVIVVGADNESIPNLLGYETAASVPEALYRARNGQSQAQDVLCLHNPLTVVCQLPESLS